MRKGVALVFVVLRLCNALLIPANPGSRLLHPRDNVQENLALRRSITASFHDHPFRRQSALHLSTNDEATSNDNQPPKLFSLGMVLFPVATVVFDTLLQLARSLPPDSSEQLATITVLFVSNRVYIYLLAVTIVLLAATRGANDAPQLGRRITDLTEELLYRPSLDKKIGAITTTSKETNDSQPSDKPALIQSLTNSGLEDSLDEISTETQALILPLLVSFFLALSVFLLPFWNGSPPMVGETSVGRDISNLLSTIVPTVSQLWNVGLLTLFTRSEIRRLCYELQWFPDLAIVEWVAAVSITGLAYWAQLWPAQNFVNMALAILVARAIQLNSFLAVVGALGLLTVYDATSVFLIPAASSTSDLSLMDPSNSVLSSSLLTSAIDGSSVGRSAMGSVAIQKLTSGTFQPGLLVTKIGNNLGGSLGLGDAVFPALLATFVQRFDNLQQRQQQQSQESKGRVSLLAVSITGYLLGCLVCEFAPSLSTTGLPALVFIIPSMLGLVVMASAITGELGELFAFDPSKED